MILVEASNAGLTADQIIAIVVGGSLLAVLTWGVHKLGSVVDKLGTIEKNSQAVIDVLVTPEPSPLNPNPAPGFLDLVGRHDRWLRSVDRSIGVILSASKTIVEQRAADRSGESHSVSPVETLRQITEEQTLRSRERLVDL